jgi:hypothetical protein
MSNPEDNPTSAPAPDLRARRQRHWLVASLVIVPLLVIFLVLLISAAFVIKRWRTSPQARPLTQNSVVMAAFKADFQPGQPKPGWHYYWNGTGSVGDTNAYEELHWNGGNNYVVGDADHPAPPSAKFLFLSNGKGHPGQGPFQTFSAGDENEHAIVLAFTVPEAGRYLIRDSFITRQEGGRGGQVHLRVLVSSRDTGSDVYCRSMNPMSFDRELGRCAVGDRICVCVGPDEADYHDSFGIDFAIGRY